MWDPVCCFSVTSIMWAPSMLFLSYLHYEGPQYAVYQLPPLCGTQYAVSQLPPLCGPPVCCFSVTSIMRTPSILFIIPKKGNLTLPKNWRGIQLCEYAWYDRIISNRIKLWMTVHESQTAYQKGKSCNNQLFTIRTITELAKKKGTPIFILFVDLEKAFDRVGRTTLLSTLMKAGMGSNMLRALKNLHSRTKIVLSKIGRLTSASGIRQGLYLYYFC